MDLNQDNSLLVDISDALSEREKVKFTVHTKVIFIVLNFEIFIWKKWTIKTKDLLWIEMKISDFQVVCFEKFRILTYIYTFSQNFIFILYNIVIVNINIVWYY